MIPFTFFLIQLIDKLDQLLGHPSHRLCDLIGKSSWWNVEVYLAGQVKADGTWQLQGVFVTKEQAESSCRDGNYFVAPVMLGEVLPHETAYFPKAYYPLAQEGQLT